MPRQAIVLLLNTTGTDNEKILMRVSVPHQSLELIVLRWQRKKTEMERERVNEMKYARVFACVCVRWLLWVRKTRRPKKKNSKWEMGRGRVLIEYDHTFNIFLRVKQAESPSLPPTHSCRTSSGPSRSLLWICTVFPQLDSQTAGDLFTSHPRLHLSFFPKLQMTKLRMNILLAKSGW